MASYWLNSFLPFSPFHVYFSADSNGEWLISASIWERQADKKIQDAFRHDLKDRNGANVMVSTDQGKSWSYRGQAHVPKRVFDEHMIVERGDASLRQWGRLLANGRPNLLRDRLRQIAPSACP